MNIGQPAAGGNFDEATDMTGSRAIDGTVYQNDSPKPMFCAVAVQGNGVALNCLAYIGSTSSPAIKAAQVNDPTASGGDVLSFVVPPMWYYKVTPVGSHTMAHWTEWS